MASLKEADFVRNGNTKKVTALRRSEQDGIWEAVQKGDYALYHSLMGKILPPVSSYNAAGEQQQQQQQQQAGQPSRPSSQPATEGAASNSNAPSTAPVPNRVSSLYSLSSGLGNSSSTSLTPSVNTLALTGSSDDPPAHNADDGQSTPTSAATTPGTLKGPGLPGLKTIPVRFILQGGTILQESIPPLVSTGTGEEATSSRHTTLALVLHTLFPALFPISTTSKPSFSLGLDFSSSAGGHDPNDVNVDALAVPITQGIRVPLSTTMLWLNKCLAGADGWVTIVLFLLPIGDETA